MEREQIAAREVLLQLLPANGSGIARDSLWPTILADRVVSESGLGRMTNDLRKTGVVSIPAWSSERKRIPDGTYRLSRGPEFPTIWTVAPGIDTGGVRPAAA